MDMRLCHWLALAVAEKPKSISVKRKPYVLFDLGGTLVDLRGIVASMAERLQTIHIRGPIPLALQWASETAKLLPTAQARKFRPERDIAADVLCVLLEKRGRADAHDASKRLVVDAWNGFAKICAFHPDASVDWLRGLRSEVAGLGLVTDGDSEAVDAVLAHLRLSELFDAVTPSEAVRSYKPDARIYRAALEALRAKPAESLFVSDAGLDLQGAAAIGMAGAWIPRDFLPELGTAPPRTAVLRSLHDVEKIVSRFSRTGKFALR